MAHPRPHITVVGLGPAGSAYLSGAVTTLMAQAERVFLRTTRHPAAAEFGAFDSFDALYESAETFEALYLAIVERLVSEAQVHAPDPIVYAVPGSPLVAERTVALLRDDDRVDVTIIPALSFLDLAWDRLGIDPLHEGLRVVDAEQFATQAAGQQGPFLVAQCWSPSLLSDIKLSVPDADDAALPRVTLLHHLGLDDERVEEVDWWDLDRSLSPDHLTSIYIPALVAPVGVPRAMDDLEALMVTLRANCPWDQAQSHASLMPHLIEESYEVLDALSALDASAGAAEAYAHLEEELGDLLFQIIFHARLAQEEGQFSLDDVARGVHDKLVHRHPHVFGQVEADTPGQVIANWEAIKKEEKGRASVTEGIPSQLPALMLASKLGRKARSVGMDGTGQAEDAGLLLDQLRRAVASVDAGQSDAPLGDETLMDDVIGKLLMEVADMARRLGVDGEQALRRRATWLRERILAAEASQASHDGEQA
jgi:tetrapyrrole methylase family protein/MazG family protein